MTDREAARIMPYLIDRCHSPAEKTALRKAGKALQEREERSRGCKWCNSGSFAPALHVDENRQLRQMHVEFCPMCGRPLKGADNGKNT